MKSTGRQATFRRPMEHLNETPSKGAQSVRRIKMKLDWAEFV